MFRVEDTMKLKLSLSLLRKLLIGITAFNVLLLVTFVFLIISATVFENYTIFMLSIPAYLFSESWLLIIGLFGFEGCLIFYYWTKSKKANVQPRNFTAEVDETIDFDFLTEELTEQSDETSLPNTRSTNDLYLQPSTDIFSVEEPMSNTRSEGFIPETVEASQTEIEFDRLWEEAINHVKNALDKKKTGSSVELADDEEEDERGILEEGREIVKEVKNKKSAFVEQNKPTILDYTKTDLPKKTPTQTNEDINRLSRAVISKARMKPKVKVANPSIIREHHREFYNELALNTWIYHNSTDRDRVGLYKLALNETKFREKDIGYLIDAGIIYKLLIPFPSGPFVVFSIYESEDRKIIYNYIAKFCKQNGLSMNQKSIAFVNYSDLGLDRKNWRFDFYINDAVVGLLWISNYIIEDEETNTFSLAYNQKKELKALLATSQINFKDENLTALIIIDYQINEEIIQRYIESQGFGKAKILPVGEKNFEKRLLSELRTSISA